MSKKPSIVVMGAGVKRISMVAIDLGFTARAVELAHRLAERTGSTVTIRDGDGALIDTVQAPSLN